MTSTARARPEATTSGAVPHKWLALTVVCISVTVIVLADWQGRLLAVVALALGLFAWVRMVRHLAARLGLRRWPPLLLDARVSGGKRGGLPVCWREPGPWGLCPIGANLLVEKRLSSLYAA